MKFFPLTLYIIKQLENTNLANARPNTFPPDPFFMPQPSPSAATTTAMCGKSRPALDPHFHDHESRQTQATRRLQTSGFTKNQQEERSLDCLEEIFVSVALYFLLTAKKSDGDFQRSSRLTNNNHKAHTDRKGKKSSVPSRACVKAAVRI